MLKTRLEGDHQSLTFSLMQLVDTMQPGGATTTSTTTNFSPQHLETFWVKISKTNFCFNCKARPLIRALVTINTYASVSVLEKPPLKISISVGGWVEKWAPYEDSLEALGLKCCVVCVMWCDEV